LKVPIYKAPGKERFDFTRVNRKGPAKNKKKDGVGKDCTGGRKEDEGKGKAGPTKGWGSL